MPRYLLAIFLIIGVAASAQADQAAWISKDAAERAVSILRGTKTKLLRAYCAPCGDKNWQPLPIRTMTVAHTGHEQYYEVRINGKGIDLAYVYFLYDGSWINVARNAGLPVEDVPDVLPATIPVAH